MNASDQPRLVVVTGRPAAGKTTLAHLLGGELGWRVVSRDAIKEAAGVRAAQDRDAVAACVYQMFIDALHSALSRGEHVIAEAAFQHELWTTTLEALQPGADVRIIVCTLEPAMAEARLIERLTIDPRRWFHDDAEIGAAMIRTYRPPALDVPTLVVETRDGYRPALDDVVAFARDSAVTP